MSTEAIETEYDYEGNQYEYALESHAAEVNELVDQMATAWLQMGDKLRAAKAWLRPGQWAGWVRAKCRFSLDTADRMVKTSELIASRPALREIQQLNNAKTIFGILCNPKTPIEAVDEVEAEVKEDGIKSRDDVKEIVAKHAKAPQPAEGDDEPEPEIGGTDPRETRPKPIKARETKEIVVSQEDRFIECAITLREIAAEETSPKAYRRYSAELREIAELMDIYARTHEAPL